jgi:hypothetical protein
MKASYKLALKKHQRRLNLTHKELNKLDRKHNDTNLIKQLQLLNPITAVSPPADTGFYGSLLVTNQTSGVAKYIQVKLAFNNVDITNYITINGGGSQTLNVPIGSRLPNPNSILQLKLIGETGVTQIDAPVFNGFTPTNLTNFPYTSENTLSMLVASNFINNGALSLTLAVTSPPPPPANTGWYGNIYMELVSYRSILVGYSYTIYKGSTTASGVLASSSLSTSNFNQPISSIAHQLSQNERLANPSSSFLLVITNTFGGDFALHSLVNVATIINNYNITPNIIPNDVRIRFSIEQP